ncbi:deaminase domain-containing protein [Clostridium saccharoperbutylacetonicum]|uniref:deaminase domain-containing protein n=1 Tax=Clostridium saccharoperbutylacetonicum TaxID=36745 RepID=UPI0039E9A17A
MTQENSQLKKKIKKERIRINNLSDFRAALKKEGYDINGLEEEKFIDKIIDILKLDRSVAKKIFTSFKDTDVTFRANDIMDFIDYMKKISLFENEHNKLCEKIRKIKKLSIARVEYERELKSKDDVEYIITRIEEIKSDISEIANHEEKEKLYSLEKEIEKEYLYTKDIELLKKMLITRKECSREKYNEETKIKVVSIEIPKDIDYRYIPAQIGTIEYHQHLSNNIPRMQRLTKNINKYMKVHENEKTTFKINQSKALQDSINIALATYDNKEFKAISGSNNIADYCIAPKEEEAVFKSNKVNKLGELGIGYNRVNDSEKKILEEIHKQIEEKTLKDEGNLILLSKWEPCPSCYFVISQFCKMHPQIKVQVKYSKKYGE